LPKTLQFAEPVTVFKLIFINSEGEVVDFRIPDSAFPEKLDPDPKALNGAFVQKY
jgi:hypothetical protein